MNGGLIVDMQHNLQNKIQTLQFYTCFHGAKKSREKDSQTKALLMWRGIRRHPQAYGFHLS